MTEPRLIGDRYELGALLGYGGMAEVHLGRDVRLGRQVALKILRSDLARDPSFQTRFRREAQAAGGLNHPSIVAVYDTGEERGPDGVVPFIVMEYVDGRTLRDILSSETRLEPGRAMEIVAEVCAALDFSHRHGIVHRDIKPANVMITKNGAVKVMDFGIARAVADNSVTVTQTAAVIGTAQYLSPEQARGEPVDARSDVYSTGCLLYELVTGQPPFQGDSPVAVAYQHVRESAAVPSTIIPSVPRALDSIVMKALAKNPLNRYQSAADMRADLQRALDDRPVAAEPVLSAEERTQLIARSNAVPRRGPDSGPIRLSEPVEPDSTRRGALIWLAAILALLLVIGAGAYLILRPSAKNAAVPPVTTAVPSLVGVKAAAVAGKLSQSKLQPDPQSPTLVQTCPIATVAIGEVCSQNPSANRQVNQGTSVAFTVLTSPAKVTVPSLQGLTVADASKLLLSLNLQPRPTDMNDPRTKGQVIGQKPDIGVSVDPGTVVTLDVANGKIRVPDVTGSDEVSGRKTLNNDGLNVAPRTKTVQTTVQRDDGKIQQTDPAGGSWILPSQSVTLYIYRYNPPPPPPPTLPACSSSPATSTSGASPSGSSSSSGSPSLSPSKSPSPSNTPSPTCT